MSEVSPGSVKVWVLAARPATLLVGLVPVLVGTALAVGEGRHRWGPAAAALWGSIFLQIGSNFANDVFDYEKGADTAERLGPTRATQAGLLTSQQVKTGMAVSFLLAFAAGIYLTVVAGWPIIVIGLCSIAAAIAYTGGSYPLGYNGLGEVFVFLFFGLVAVPGTVFVQAGQVLPAAWLAAIPVGSLAAAVLVVNNVRDHETDRVAGKKTLVVRLGRSFGVRMYLAFLLLSWVVPAGMVALRLTSPWALLSLLTVPLGLRLWRVLRSEYSGPVLNRCLAGTARLLFLFGLLLAVGLARGGGR
ncbi:MAG: 1,4-dihydroxy-2-naphthoate polyprenyltransferase [Myxococcales bacterium]|nr:1,4-dihydroxy-2-naphthoate polyprenyltransferase [Polyangiaceae bacterium]MDW8247725.1 1,4-dihydroxy-2-naphthoate polyprenyltransferase [Myxococcales bacterium]